MQNMAMQAAANAAASSASGVAAGAAAGKSIYDYLMPRPFRKFSTFSITNFNHFSHFVVTRRIFLHIFWLSILTRSRRCWYVRITLTT